MVRISQAEHFSRFRNLLSRYLERNATLADLLYLLSATSVSFRGSDMKWIFSSVKWSLIRKRCLFLFKFIAKNFILVTMNSKSPRTAKRATMGRRALPAVEFMKYSAFSYGPLNVTVMSSQTAKSLPNNCRLLCTLIISLHSIDESRETKTCVRY